MNIRGISELKQYPSNILCADNTIDDSVLSSWLNVDDNLKDAYIEITIPNPDSDSAERKSKKFPFGDLLEYLKDTIDKLARRSLNDYLTHEEANELYVPLSGTDENNPIWGGLHFANAHHAPREQDTLLIDPTNNSYGTSYISARTIYTPQLKAEDAIITADHVTDLTANTLTAETAYATLANPTTLKINETLTAQAGTGEINVGKLNALIANIDKNLNVDVNGSNNGLATIWNADFKNEITVKAVNSTEYKCYKNITETASLFCGMNAASGVWQTDGAAQLTAKAALWS